MNDRLWEICFEIVYSNCKAVGLTRFDSWHSHCGHTQTQFRVTTLACLTVHMHLNGCFFIGENMKTIIKSSFDIIPLEIPCYNVVNKNKVGNKMMDPEISRVVGQLAAIAIRNTATIVHDKISASKAQRNDKETIAELTDIIQDLLSDKQDLQMISESLKDELVSQKLSDEDLNFVAETVVPTIEKIMPNNNEKMLADIDKIKPLLSRNTLNVLQTLGFNFKRGIGEPLTDLLNGVIRGMNDKQSNDVTVAMLNRDTEYFKMIQDEEAFMRWQSLQK